MALKDIKRKILGEAQAKAAEITAAAEKLAAQNLEAAQKTIRRERQIAKDQLAKEHEQALQPRLQVLALEGEHRILALKREYLQQTLDLAVERITQKKLPEFYTKIFKEIKLDGAQIFVGGDIAPAETACRKLAVEPKIVLKKDWPIGRVEIDYGKSRLDCSLPLYAKELAKTMESELAERLWP